MSITVSLYPNLIQKDGSEFAKVVSSANVNFDAILEYMSKDTALEKTDMLAVFTKFREALLYHLQMGHRVVTPIGKFAPGISNGTVWTNGHVPQIEKDSLKINFTASNDLINEFRLYAQLDSQDYTGAKIPLIKHLSNVANEDEDTIFPVGSLCHIVGSKLSFNNAERGEGVFFVSEDESTSTRMFTYSRSGSHYIDFLLEGVTPGNYYVEIRNADQVGRYKKIIEVQ